MDNLVYCVNCKKVVKNPIFVDEFKHTMRIGKTYWIRRIYVCPVCTKYIYTKEVKKDV